MKNQTETDTKVVKILPTSPPHTTINQLLHPMSNETGLVPGSYAKSGKRRVGDLQGLDIVDRDTGKNNASEKFVFCGSANLVSRPGHADMGE